MLARLRVRLPFSLQIIGSSPLEPQERTFASHRVRYFSPLAAANPPADPNGTIDQVTDALEPTPTPPPRSDLTVDKEAAYDAEILQLDFLGREFDRREGADDPPTEVLLRAVSDWVARLRHITRAGHARLPAPFPWRLQYLHDTVGAVTVDFPKAVAMVATAAQIITWVEDQLPSDMARPRATELHQVEMTQMLAAPRPAAPS